LRSQHIKTKCYYCNECGRGFNDNRHYKNHLVTHIDSQPYKCDLCPKGYKRKQLLEFHLIGSHQTERKLQCTNCDYETLNLQQLKKHRNIHLKNFICDVCKKEFKERRYLTLHYEAVHVKEKNYQCLVCEKDFITVQYVKRHLKRLHDGDLTKFRCLAPEKIAQRKIPENRVPDQAIKRKNMLSMPKQMKKSAPKKCLGHENVAETVEHQNYNNIVSSNELPEEHQIKSEYDIKSEIEVSSDMIDEIKTEYAEHDENSQEYQHVKDEHPEDVTQYRITPYQPRMSFSTIRYMENQTFTCPTCSINFQTRSALLLHEPKCKLRNKADDNLKCEFCDKKFSDQFTLDVHVNVRHVNAKIHKCRECDYETHQYFDFRNHRMTHMNLIKCQKCLKEFPTEKLMLEHAKDAHIGPSEFKCETCLVGFKSSVFLQRHMKTAHSVSKFDCKYCEKSFETRNELNQHVGNLWKIKKCSSFIKPELTTEIQHKVLQYIHQIMSKRRHSQHSLPDHIKIKIEKDCEEEESLIVQNIQQTSSYDDVNKIKKEIELIVDDKDEDGPTSDDEIESSSDNSSHKLIDVKLEPQECPAEEPDDNIKDEFMIIKEEIDGFGVDLVKIEVKISKVDMEIAEPYAKKLRLDQGRMASRQTTSGMKLSQKLTEKSGKIENSAQNEGNKVKKSTKNSKIQDRMSLSSINDAGSEDFDGSDDINYEDNDRLSTSDDNSLKTANKVRQSKESALKGTKNPQNVKNSSKSARKAPQSTSKSRKSDSNLNKISNYFSKSEAGASMEAGNNSKQQMDEGGLSSNEQDVENSQKSSKKTAESEDVKGQTEDSGEMLGKSSENLRTASSKSGMAAKNSKNSGKSSENSRKNSGNLRKIPESSDKISGKTRNFGENSDNFAENLSNSDENLRKFNENSGNFIGNPGNPQENSRSSDENSTNFPSNSNNLASNSDNFPENSSKMSKSSTKMPKKSANLSKKSQNLTEKSQISTESPQNSQKSTSVPSKPPRKSRNSSTNPSNSPNPIPKLTKVTSKSSKSLKITKIDSKSKNPSKSPSTATNDQNNFEIHSSLSIEDTKDPRLAALFNPITIKTESNPKLTSKSPQIDNADIQKLHEMHLDALGIGTGDAACSQKLSSPKKEFQCKLCPKSYDKRVSLFNHQAAHTSYDYPCLKCGLKFKSQRAINNHECPICEYCGKKFKNKPKLIRHVTYVHSDQSNLELFSCDLCGKSLKYKISIDRHMKEHLEVTKNLQFKCEICHKSFTKRMGLQNHQILHVYATLTCNKCGMKFKKQKPYDQHVCLTCTHCPKNFSSKTKLNDHIRNIHTDESQLSLYICDICGKSFKYRPSIVRHVLDHREEAKYKCEVCGKKWKSDIALRDHIRMCHAVELITCKICHKEMKPQCIYQHMKYVHTTVRDFTCKICDAAFKTKEKLKRHLDTHNRKFNCVQCDRKFSSLYELTEHLKWHEDPDIFKCSICKKSFSTRTSLTTHSKLHKGIVRNLKCPHCPFTTHRKESIKYHLTTHEKRDKMAEMKKNWHKCDKCGALLKNKASLWGHHRKVHPTEKFTCDYCGVIVKTKHSLKHHIDVKHVGN
ncbi:uncharacterized protein, partial [Chironomus tepperi]|uniref:uncharacterized protein n=1 Tax=Chironomus tepperi TaxID=113505 RepID=UPI00391F0976